jgi:hypothetical protein
MKGLRTSEQKKSYPHLHTNTAAHHAASAGVFTAVGDNGDPLTGLRFSRPSTSHMPHRNTRFSWPRVSQPKGIHLYWYETSVLCRFCLCRFEAPAKPPILRRSSPAPGNPDRVLDPGTCLLAGDSLQASSGMDTHAQWSLSGGQVQTRRAHTPLACGDPLQGSCRPP